METNAEKEEVKNIPYTPYKGLISLQNSPQVVPTNFNWKGYRDWMSKRLTIIDKKKVEVPFTQKPAQDDLLYHMSLYLNILVLKARKMGFSSTALGVGTGKFILGRNEKVVSMSFDATASGKQLSRVKHYIKSYERITGTKIPFKYNSKTELVWEGCDPETGEEWVNTLQVGTAKSTSFGRGDDITFLHLTEVGFVDDIEILLSGVGEACLPGSHKILETTANGFNSYKEFWDRTILNKTGFAGLFYTPEWEYDEAYLSEKREILGRLYDQEYPFTPIEAFLTSGQPFFNQQAVKGYYNEVNKDRT